MAAADPAWAVKEVVAATCQAAAVTDQEQAAAEPVSRAHWMTARPVPARAQVPARRTHGRPAAAVRLAAEPAERVVRRILRMLEPSLWQRPALPHLPANQTTVQLGSRKSPLRRVWLGACLRLESRETH